MILDDKGKKKLPTLVALANCVLTLSYGNADPEQGFSINKHLLKIHGSMTSESTVEALRLVKDFIIRKGGIEKVSISKTLIKNGQNSHALYRAKLAEENRQILEAAENAKRIEEDHQKATDIEEIDNDILMIKNGIKIAEKSIKEGNLLEKQLKQSNLNRDALASAHSKISMGVKRKNELENSLKSAEIKRKKLT